MSFYLFDLDGTLTDCRHRLHIIRGQDPDKWNKFYLESFHDPLRTHVAHIFNLLPREQTLIWTGRGAVARDITVDYLQRNLHVNDQWIEFNFRMRDEDDFRTGEDLKQSWLDLLRLETGENVTMAFEDDPKMDNFYKRNDIPFFLV